MTTATEQVLTVLSAGALPVEAQAFLLTTFSGEVGDHGPDRVPVTDPFTVQCGYTYWSGSLSTFPPWPGISVGGGLVSTAFGAFQITHTTWAGWNTLSGAPQDMEPPSQCLLAWLGAESVYHGKTGRILLADLQTGLLGNVQTNLLKTWPGGMRKFASAYPGYLALLKTPPPPLPPPPTPESATITITDSSGAQWTLSGVLTKVTTHMVAATIGAGSLAYVASQSPRSPGSAEVPPSLSPPAVVANPMDRLSEWETCCRVVEQVTRGLYHC